MGEDGRRWEKMCKLFLVSSNSWGGIGSFMLLLARCVPNLGTAPKPPSINPNPLEGHPIPPFDTSQPTAAQGDVDGLVFPWVGSEISPAAGATRPALETPPGWCVTMRDARSWESGRLWVISCGKKTNYRSVVGVFSDWSDLVILRKFWDWTDSITRLYPIFAHHCWTIPLRHQNDQPQESKHT